MIHSKKIKPLKPKRPPADIEFLRSIGAIPVPLGKGPDAKKPSIKNWTDPKSLSAFKDWNRHLNDGGNIGALLGLNSHDLVCVDLDSANAIKLAASFLPKTNLVHGRPGSLHSHLYYRSPNSKNSPDPKGVEVLSTGRQVVVPHSLHYNSNTHLEWEGQDEPLRVSSEALSKAVNILRAACIIAEQWKEGKRNDLTLHFAGAAIRRDWTTENITDFVCRIAEAMGDNEIDSRIDAINITASKFKDKKPTTGIPSIQKILPQEETKKLCGYLGWVIGPVVSIAQKEGEGFMNIILDSIYSKELNPAEKIVLFEFLRRGGYTDPLVFSPDIINGVSPKTFLRASKTLVEASLVEIVRRGKKLKNVWKPGKALQQLMKDATQGHEE